MIVAYAMLVGDIVPFEFTRYDNIMLAKHET
jgi:hypothetical protein